MRNSKIKSLLFIIVIFLFGISGGLFISRYKSEWFTKTNEPENKYLAFLQEVRVIIQENYWDSFSEDALVRLHVKAIEQIVAQPLGDRIKTYQDLDDEIIAILENYTDDSTKEEFTTQLADLVLANLEPFGRSRLYSQQLEKELVEKVSNINPDLDHYQSLGVNPEATNEEVEQAYHKQKELLQTEDTPESKQQLAQLELAQQTLLSQENRERYDKSGVNPTMEWRLISPQIFYLKIKQFSPTTVEELLEITQKVDGEDERLSSLILDLRGNIGGAIDGLPYFLGPFIGNNQYAYQMLQQGKTTDFKTKVGWLPTLARYKKVVVLIDEEVQSSAEVMADVLQKYNVGVLIGTTTKGWGTVERIFPIKNQVNQTQEYSIFLVHHLTLRSDGIAIESNGVNPDVDISVPNWQKELLKYFNDDELVGAVEKLI